MKRLSILIFILSTLSIGSTAIGQEKSITLLAGKYHVVFTNISEKKVEKKFEAELTLVPTSENNVSPRTGEKAPSDGNRREIPLY